MSTTYRIAEVADRSGFTPATLRYYEDIGLLAPVGRTAAGYRVYDDSSIERLRFIARAKQLGCTLDEVADLSAAWDDGRCQHVKDRLRATVATKLAEAHGRIAELTTLAADLQRAAAALTAGAADGPCDESCGCLADTPAGAGAGVGTGPDAVERSGATAVLLTGKPAAEVPIACTLDAGEMAGRMAEWAETLAEQAGLMAGVTARTPIDGGVRLAFGPGTDVAALARLAAAEQGCCRFFAFALVIDAGGLALEVRAPADAADAVTALFGAPDP
jgi:MerR family transcriptional regulator, copper efflux regulator